MHDQDNDLNNLKTRIDILEIIVAVFFTICLVFIFAIVKIYKVVFYWNNLWPFFIYAFFIALNLIYVIFPIIKIIKTVSKNIASICKEIIKEYNEKTVLGKLLIFISIFGFLVFIFKSTFPLIDWVKNLINLLIKK